MSGAIWFLGLCVVLAGYFAGAGLCDVADAIRETWGEDE